MVRVLDYRKDAPEGLVVCNLIEIFRNVWKIEENELERRDSGVRRI